MVPGVKKKIKKKGKGRGSREAAYSLRRRDAEGRRAEATRQPLCQTADVHLGTPLRGAARDGSLFPCHSSPAGGGGAVCQPP